MLKFFWWLIVGTLPQKCHHKWTTVSETTLPSPYEQMKDRMTKASKMGMSAFQKKHIVILTCDFCGNVKEIVNTLLSKDTELFS